MVHKCPCSKISTLYETLYKEMLKNFSNISWQDDMRVIAYYSNRYIPSIKRIIQSIELEGDILNDIMIMKEVNNSSLYQLLKDIYNFHCGRLTNIERVLLWYPDYLQYVYKMTQTLMLGEGPLPVDWRYFIAILAVASYGCEYLYYLLVDNFLNAGGDRKWLEDNQNLPNKILKIIDICFELGYKPWHFKHNPAVLQSIVKGNHSWSRQELVQLFTIVAFYQCLCSLVYGMGILPEPDFPRETQKDLFMRQDDNILDLMLKSGSKIKETEDILSKLRLLSLEEDKTTNKDEFDLDLQSELLKKKYKLEELLKDDSINLQKAKNNKLFEKYFNQKNPEFKSFEYHGGSGIYSTDYTWKFHGYTELGNYFFDLANIINEKHSYITTLTLKCFAEENHINTKPYRTAIYHYTEFIHGYFRPDYDYKDVNTYLHKDLKALIKLSACVPQAMSFEAICKIPIKFKPYEMCHLYLLIMEAKFHVQLMWGLLAVQKL